MGRNQDRDLLKNQILVVTLEELKSRSMDVATYDLLAFIEQTIDETPEMQKFRTKIQKWSSEKRMNWLDSNCL